MPLKELLTEASKLLQIENFDPIANCVLVLQQDGKIIVNDDVAALQNIYQTEVDIANSMKYLVEARQDQEDERYSDKEMDSAIKDAEKELKIKYDETQKLAIKMR